ncbi:60S ribosome subunit biogenesis protein NIP7-like protein [Aphelenchoides fujianensis]|nr:60S ribosome subunit biogenesis protein NIP7-like protein [Aphelenchoides fujianensis]
MQEIEGRIPGTGKTASVQAVVDSLRKRRGKKNHFEYVYVNCLGIRNQTDFCTEIYEQLVAEEDAKKLRPQNAMKETEQVLFDSQCVLVLDEIDSLLQLKATLFSLVFGWPEKSKGAVLLIGISNTLDLLKRHLKHPPPEILFKAYTSDQIEQILEAQEAVEANALKLCAQKVAKQTGDIRRAITLADEMIKMRPPTDENRDETYTTPTKKPRTDKENATPPSPRTPSSACRDVLAAINRVAASPAVRAQLPLKQKIVLACILQLLKHWKDQKKRLVVKRTKLFEMYRLACDKQQVDHFGHTAFAGLDDSLNFLAMSGMLKVDKEKITVYVDVDAAKNAISDHALVQSIQEIPVGHLTSAKNIKLLLECDDGNYCFRFHRDRVYYANEKLMRVAAVVERKQLISFGTCLGKFTKSGKFFLHITALDYLAPYAKWRVWLKPAAEQQFLYGNNILKSGVGRMTEGTEARQGADLGEYIRNEAALI